MLLLLHSHSQWDTHKNQSKAVYLLKKHKTLQNRKKGMKYTYEATLAVCSRVGLALLDCLLLLAAAVEGALLLDMVTGVIVPGNSGKLLNHQWHHCRQAG